MVEEKLSVQDPAKMSIEGRILFGYVELTPDEDQGLACLQTHESTMNKIIVRVGNESEGVN